MNHKNCSYDYKKKIAISVDTYVDKIHFVNFKQPDLVIKKCLRSSLSDLICKGINPKWKATQCQDTYDGPGECLRFIYNSLRPAALHIIEQNVRIFNATKYIINGTGLQPFGYIYLPTECYPRRQQKCKLVIFYMIFIILLKTEI